MTVPEVLRNAQIQCARALLNELDHGECNTDLQCKTPDDSLSGGWRPLLEVVYQLYGNVLDAEQGYGDLASSWTALIDRICEHPEPFSEAAGSVTSGWKGEMDSAWQQCKRDFDSWLESCHQFVPYKYVELERWMEDREAKKDALLRQVEDIEKIRPKQLLMLKVRDFAAEAKSGSVAKTPMDLGFEPGQAKEELFLWSIGADLDVPPAAGDAGA